MNKRYFLMFCYQWTANGCQGLGSNVLSSDSEFILDKDIVLATKFIKKFVANQMHHNQESIQIIYTNIIKLAHCTSDEYYKKEETPH